jgi:hypothetical protein
MRVENKAIIPPFMFPVGVFQWSMCVSCMVEKHATLQGLQAIMHNVASRASCQEH